MTTTPPPAYGPPPRIITVKNYPLRRAIAGFMVLPVLLLVLLAVLIPVAVPVILGNLQSASTEELAANIPIVPSLLLTVVGEVVVIYLALLLTGQVKTWRKALGLHNFTWKRFGAGAGIGVLLFIGLQVLASFVIAPLFGEVESSDTSVSIGNIEGFERYLILLLIVPVLVPFIEEVLFRGVVFRFINDSAIPGKLATILAILTSAFYFSILHFQGLDSATDVFLLIWIFMVGAVNAVLVWKTDSVFTAFASHFAYNFSTVLVILLAAA
jgi:membrane protease YdiL (CAAX protease family)